MDKPYLLTQAQRMDLLNSHNKLRNILQTITECMTYGFHRCSIWKP